MLLNGVRKCSVVEWSMERQRCTIVCGSAELLIGVCRCIVVEWGVEVQRC